MASKGRSIGLLLAVGLPIASGFHAAAPIGRTPMRAASAVTPSFAPLPSLALAPTANKARLPAVASPRMDAAAPSLFEKISSGFTTLFPLWTLSVAILGLTTPGIFAGISTSYFTALLAALMLSMGITLTVDDFKRVLEKPAIMFFGFLGCYGMMPALALFLSRIFGLNPGLTAGMVLVGSINGGQASNLCTYIAKGDVALSVLMTTVTTIGAIFMTPLLCQLVSLR